MKRKLPKVGTEEAVQFCQLWDISTHAGKMELTDKYSVSYQQARDYRCNCRGAEVMKRDYKLIPDVPWEEQLDTFKKMDKLVAIHQQFPTEITIILDTELPIAIPFAADFHLGAPGVDYEGFQDDIELMESEPGIRPFIGGDGYHNIIQPGKMGSSLNQIPIAPQKGLYVLTLKKLLHKILCVGTGNHNYWTALAEGEDWDAELLRHRLKIVYIKHCAVVNLKVGQRVYPILRMHKSRFKSSFNLTHSAKQNQRLYFPDARIVVTEHTHVGAIEQYRYNEKECIAVQTGTYAVYDDYAQQNGYFGAHVCNPTVILYPKEDRLVGFKDMREAIIYLRAVRS